MKEELTTTCFNETFGYWTPLGVALDGSQKNSRVLRLLAPPDIMSGDSVRINKVVFWVGDEPVYNLLTRGAKVVKLLEDGEVEVKLSEEAFRAAQEQLGLDRQIGQTTFLHMEIVEPQ